MTMLGGSCSIHIDYPENVFDPPVVTTSGTGLAKVLADAFAPVFITPALQGCSPDASYPPYAALSDAKRVEAAAMARDAFRTATLAKFWADLANVIGPVVVGYIQANAVVDLAAVVATVSSQQVGRTPVPNDPNTAIQAPSSPVMLPVTNGGSTTIGVA